MFFTIFLSFMCVFLFDPRMFHATNFVSFLVMMFLAFINYLINFLFNVLFSFYFWIYIQDFVHN